MSITPLFKSRIYLCLYVEGFLEFSLTFALCGKLHFFLEISKLFQKIIPFFEKVFQKTRFFEKMLLEILQFLFFLSEVDAESCFTLRKSDFKREPLHFYLPNDAKFQFFQKVFKKVFQKVFQKSLCFEKFYDF